MHVAGTLLHCHTRKKWRGILCLHRGRKGKIHHHRCINEVYINLVISVYCSLLLPFFFFFNWLFGIIYNAINTFCLAYLSTLGREQIRPIEHLYTLHLLPAKAYMYLRPQVCLLFSQFPSHYTLPCRVKRFCWLEP